MKKLTLEEMQRIAAERGGKCMSDTYVDNGTKLLWECAENHQWEAVSGSIKSGRWCPECANKKRADALKLGIEEMEKSLRSTVEDVCRRAMLIIVQNLNKNWTGCPNRPTQQN